MKNIIFFSLLVLFAASFESCSKEPKMIVRHDGQIVPPDGYTWTTCQPKPLVFEKGEFVSGSGNDAIYWYYFHVSLDNSQANANGIVSSDVFFPHVGPNGVTIYSNVANDATYELLSITNGYVYFRIKTANVTATGCPLKFNLALATTPANYVWFSANGTYTQNVGIDDGVRNYYFITFLNGMIYKAF